MKSKKNTKKIKIKQKKKTETKTKKKTKKESFKIGSGRTRITARKRRKNRKKCAICLGKIRNYDLIETECNHPFHIECLEEWCKTNHSKETVLCPYCRQPINYDCSEIYKSRYESQFKPGEPIPPMEYIPRWYTGDVHFPRTPPSPRTRLPPMEDIIPRRPLMEDIPRWYTGSTMFPQTPEDSPPAISTPPRAISRPLRAISTPPRENFFYVSPPDESTIGEPRESFFYDSPPDESTMDVAEITEPLEPNISNSLSPIQPTNSLSPESRINRMAYDETLNRIYDRLRQ